jgi:hypothetical protein
MENIIFATMPVDRIIPLIVDREIAEQGAVSIYNAAGELLGKGSKSGGKFNTISVQSSIINPRFEVGIPDYMMKEKTRPFAVSPTPIPSPGSLSGSMVFRRRY